MTDMVKSIEISSSAWNVMKADAESRFPNECCGFFYGMEGSIRKVDRVLVVKNSKKGDQRRRFEISPEDYLKAELYAVQHDTDLLGVYHSHPNHPAKPSTHDLAQAAPVFSYIIISVVNGKVDEITSWQLNDQSVFDKEEITISK